MTNPELEQLKAAISVLRRIVEENNNSIKHLEEKTGDMIIAFEAARGAFKVLAFMGTLAKPLFWIISVSATCYAAFVSIKTGIK